MKTFSKLSSVERAKLLFDLFIDDIPSFVQFANKLTKSVLADPQKIKENAVDQLHTTDFWWGLVKHASNIFDQYGDALATNGTLFSEMLFDGYNSIYGEYCLHQYLLSEQCCNSKCQYAIRLFFF